MTHLNCLWLKITWRGQMFASMLWSQLLPNRPGRIHNSDHTWMGKHIFSHMTIWATSAKSWSRLGSLVCFRNVYWLHYASQAFLLVLMWLVRCLLAWASHIIATLTGSWSVGPTWLMRDKEISPSLWTRMEDLKAVKCSLLWIWIWKPLKHMGLIVQLDAQMDGTTRHLKVLRALWQR